MTITPEQAQKLLTGNQTFSQLGFSMLLTRLKGLYAKDPSQESMQTCMKEINTFMEKYAAVMTSDFVIISKL